MKVGDILRKKSTRIATVRMNETVAIAEHGAAGCNLKVSQLISVQELISCQSTDTLDHVRHLMNKHHIRHVPVIDDYTLIGVITIQDISTALENNGNDTAQSAVA